MMNAPMTHMSSAREIAFSLVEEEDDEEEEEEEDVEEDEIHPGRKLSLRLLYFSSSSLEHVVPAVVVGSSSLTLSRDGSWFLLSERIRVPCVPCEEPQSIFFSLQVPHWMRAFFFVDGARRRGKK